MTGAKSSRNAWLVYAALLALLAVSAATSRVDLGWGNLAFNLGAAVCKAALIAAFYMRLRGSAGAVRLAVIATLLMFTLLIGLSLTDTLTRGSAAKPPARADVTRSPAAPARAD